MAKATYRLRAETILAAARKYGGTAIFGIPDLLQGMDARELSEAEGRALDDLMGAGLADMDFDGNTSISADFERMIRACINAEETCVLEFRGADAGQGTWILNKCPKAENGGMAVYLQSAGQDPAGQYFIEEMPLQKCGDVLDGLADYSDIEKKFHRDFRMDSGVMQRKSRQEMLGAGLSGEEADAVLSALDGSETVLIARRVAGGQETGSLAAIISKNYGILEMAFSYSLREKTFESMEDVVFHPVIWEELKGDIFDLFQLKI